VSNTILAFDIETIPDVRAGRKLHKLDGLSDHDVAEAMWQRRRIQTGQAFLPWHLHQVVAISVLLRHHDGIRLWSIGSIDDDEAALLQRFFHGIAEFSPTLVSWNGNGFDLPVLHYRSLQCGIDASVFWEVGHKRSNWRYDHYLGRFHWRHTDLMDVLSAYQPRGGIPLDEVALLNGLPGKIGVGGDQVWPTYCDGNLEAIRAYCEIDVLNTYLLYLRFQRLRGLLDQADFQTECALVQQHLEASDHAHYQEFLRLWQADGA